MMTLVAAAALAWGGSGGAIIGGGRAPIGTATTDAFCLGDSAVPRLRYLRLFAQAV